ncbi:MAG: signal transduction histidine kinase, nitrogen specific, NtrB [Myxococcales bacterium]|nr:signal transduction histidine kinase, nitrogen specific, NtrB [Myxococcales bacterium]
MFSLRLTPTMLHSIDHQGRIEEVSDLWLTRLGYTWNEVIGRESTDFLSEESARYAREVVLPMFYQTGACEVEYDMRRKDGVLFPVRLRGVAVRSESGVFVRSIAVIEDLTEQRALERKMFAAQKLESLGLMAGNIAHDFNNLLASVVGNTQLALRYAEAVPTAVSSLNNVLVASARAADLCRQLLAYSGRGKFQIEVLDLDDLVAEMVDVLEVNVGKDAKVSLQLARSNTHVEVDATQIRQVLMNLVINAGESLVERHGTISITTSVRALAANEIASTLHPDAKPGTYVELEVADDGSGMTADVLARIFDPFFTTKATGRGLGLAAVLGIVRGHHGTMRVDSHPGQGTRFQIFLPLVEVAATRPRSMAPVPPVRGQIVVVDDDQLLRSTIERQLSDAGYDVVLATTVNETLAVARTGTVETFLVDVTVPGISGPELARLIRGVAPTSRIVLMSGYNELEMPILDHVRFLQKPFAEGELLRAIRA